MSFYPGTWQKNAGAAVKYFEELTTECVSGREAGRWGAGAKALGREGPVSVADFKALAYGKDPKTGRNITARQKSNCQAAFEVVAACPKSNSVATCWAKTSAARTAATQDRGSPCWNKAIASAPKKKPSLGPLPTPAEIRQTENYKPGMELRGIRGLGLPTKTPTVVKLHGNEVELKIGSGPYIIVDLSRLPSSAHWTVHQTQKLEIRTSDKLLLGKTGERVNIAEFSNGEPVSDRGFVIPINDSISYGWAVPETTPVKTSKVAVIGATSRIGLCRALCRCQTEAKLFTSDMLELREKLFSNNKTAGSILQSTPYPRLAINQQRLIEHCWTPAKATNTHKNAPVKTTQSIDKTPVSPREQRQGQER